MLNIELYIKLLSIYQPPITNLSVCEALFKNSSNLLLFIKYGSSASGNTINSDGEIQTAEQIYAKAKSALKREQWEEAIEAYREIEANMKGSKCLTLPVVNWYVKHIITTE